MKLRNKRTGDIWEFDEGFSMKASYETAERAGAKSGILTCYAASLAELNEEWEDYKPAEPLIKDEKIRKAVRAWAEANDIRYIEPCGRLDKRNYRIVGHNAEGRTYTMEIDNEYDCRMSFKQAEELTKFGSYTVTELCGEEEE